MVSPSLPIDFESGPADEIIAATSLVHRIPAGQLAPAAAIPVS